LSLGWNRQRSLVTGNKRSRCPSAHFTPHGNTPPPPGKLPACEQCFSFHDGDGKGEIQPDMNAPRSDHISRSSCAHEMNVPPLPKRRDRKIHSFEFPSGDTPPIPNEYPRSSLIHYCPPYGRIHQTLFTLFLLCVRVINPSLILII
jgi:hypothetical protein